jgi:Fur family ferric uptake transcriptional regulator
MSNASPGWSADALASLHERGFRSGGARRAIIEFLGRQPCCLSATEIFEALRAEGARVGIASVYRVLDLLTRQLLVQRVEVGGGHVRYEPVYRDGDHHHHVVCDECGKVEAFSDRKLEGAIREVEGRVGYAIATHEVVLHGECGDCRRS